MCAFGKESTALYHWHMMFLTATQLALLFSLLATLVNYYGCKKVMVKNLQNATTVRKVSIGKKIQMKVTQNLIIKAHSIEYVVLISYMSAIITALMQTQSDGQKSWHAPKITVFTVIMIFL